VAATDRTCAVLNTTSSRPCYTPARQADFDPDALREEIFEHCLGRALFRQNLSELCEQRLGSKLFANIMMLGVAFQLGPDSGFAAAIAWAIKDTIRRDHRKNLKAFNIGRKLALEPRALPRKPEPDTWEQLVTNKGAHPAQDPLPFGRAAAMI
jgi:indolepyruvate ferredoxin oxidoreductase